MTYPISKPLDFCLRLSKAHASLVRRLDGRLGTLHGLSFGDFMILLHLGRAPGGRLRRVDLAGMLGLTASAVTRTLIPLEKIGVVTRQRDPRDARVGYASLTPAGRRLLEDAITAAEVASEDAVTSANAPQLGALSKVLAELGGD
jgi:DNA-binding MarR family transcriptional regulator